MVLTIGSASPSTEHSTHHSLCGAAPAHIHPASPGACLLVPVYLRHSSGHARAVGAWRKRGGRRGKREGGKGRREETGRRGREERKGGERREEGEVKYMSLDKLENGKKKCLTN